MLYAPAVHLMVFSELSWYKVDSEASDDGQTSQWSLAARRSMVNSSTLRIAFSRLMTSTCNTNYIHVKKLCIKTVIHAILKLIAGRQNILSQTTP